MLLLTKAFLKTSLSCSCIFLCVIKVLYLYTAQNRQWHSLLRKDTHSWLKLELKLKSRPQRWERGMSLDPDARTFSQISPNWTSAGRSRVEIVACSCRSIDRSFLRAARVWSNGSGTFFGRTRHPGSRPKDRSWNQLGDWLFAFPFGQATCTVSCHGM